MRLCAIATTAALIVGGSAAHAGVPSKLFLGEYEFNNPTLSSMNLDGANVQELFSPAPSDWLVVGLDYGAAGADLYWCHGSSPGTVRTAALDGSGEHVVVGGLKYPRGLALDPMGGNLYWSASPPAGHALGLIQRVDTDGTGLQNFFVLTPYDPNFSFVGNPTVDPTNGYVYFCAANQIVRKRTDGTGGVETVVRGVTTVRSVALDVENGQIYFLDANTNSDYLGRCNLDDTGFTVLVDMSPASTVSSGLWDLELDLAGGKAYWADEIAHVVRRANLDGANVQTIYTSPAASSPTGLAFDDNTPPPMADCNGNSVPDRDDIDSQASADCNGNGVPDECEADPCATPTYVLDHGSDPAAVGRTVSGDPSTGYEVFQPFDVAGALTLQGIELDGWTVNYHSDGFTATLFPDDGTGTFANESTPIESSPFQWRFSPSTVVWVERDFSATLAPGRYWIRLTASHPDYDAAAHVGVSGLPSKSRRNSDGQIIASSRAIALRLVEGNAAGVSNTDLALARAIPVRVVPNPMHGRAEVQFELSPEYGRAAGLANGNEVGQSARVEIHDILGRVVRTLEVRAFDGATALHRVGWDGRDQSGRAVSSGQYYCLIDAGSRQGRAVVTLVQ